MKLLAPAMVLVLVGSAAAAQSHRAASAGDPLGTTPAEQFTITNYYKQDVYDRSLNFLGTVDDVLIDQQGKITALIIGVGGVSVSVIKTFRSRLEAFRWPGKTVNGIWSSMPTRKRLGVRPQ